MWDPGCSAVDTRRSISSEDFVAHLHRPVDGRGDAGVRRSPRMRSTAACPQPNIPDPTSHYPCEMSSDLLKPLIRAALPDLIRIRHDLHAHPELGYQERRTSKVVADELSRLKIVHKSGL